MESFRYVDIFATKHFEYLLVIGFLLLLIPFWRLLNRPAKSILEATERVFPEMSGWFRLPEDLYYHLGHSWAAPQSKNVVKVGLNDFAQKLVGPIDAVQVPKLGSMISQGERGWALRVDSKAIDMVSPVDGKVIAVNEEVLKAPEEINKDPYGSWLIEVETPKFSADKKQLLSGAMAKRWMEVVREKLMSRMNDSLGMVYQDGGLLVDGMAKHLDKERWDSIAKEFFLVSEGSLEAEGFSSQPPFISV